MLRLVPNEPAPQNLVPALLVERCGVACLIDNTPPDESGIVASWQVDVHYAGWKADIVQRLGPLSRAAPAPRGQLLVAAVRYRQEPATHAVHVFDTFAEQRGQGERELLLTFLLAGDDHQAVDFSLQVVLGVLRGTLCGVRADADCRARGAWESYLVQAGLAAKTRQLQRAATGPN